MSTNETEMSMTSPKIRKAVPRDVPSTPTSRTRRRMAALSPSDGISELVPLSPGIKRTNSGTLKSPDYRLNTKDIMSPAILATPRNNGYDSNDDKDTPKSKFSRNPLFFSPKARTGDDHAPLKEDLNVISSQLKDKLSLALGSVQRKENHIVSPNRLNFTNSWLTNSADSPTRRKGSFAQSPPRNLPAASINLQTLQQSPCVYSNSPRHEQTSSFLLQQSANFSCEQPLKLPSPDETSAHSALLEAFSRSKKRQQSDTNEHANPFGISTPLLGKLQSLPFEVKTEGKPKNVPFSLPSISVAVPLKSSDESEQDAVLSLMSLASPQGIKKPLSHSFNGQAGNSATLSRSPSAPVLPPITGLIGKIDDDETDVEDPSSSD